MPFRFALQAAGLAMTLFATTTAGQSSQVRSNRVRAPEPGSISRPMLNRTTAPLWQNAAKSRGQRSIQALHSGDGDFRVLVIGSLAGNDPLSLTLLDDLAKHLSKNAGIVGGFRAVLVRSANPDAAALNRVTDAANVRIETAFPQTGSKARALEPEVQFVIRLLREFKPHRVVHLTPGGGNKPVVLHNNAAAGLARDLSEWLEAARKPSTRFAPRGSMEHYLGETAEVVTLLIPKGSRRDTLPTRYSDSLLTCLVPPIEMADEVWPPPTAGKNHAQPAAAPSGRHKVEELPRPGDRTSRSQTPNVPNRQSANGQSPEVVH